MGNDQAVAYAKVPTNAAKTSVKPPRTQAKALYEVSLTSGEIQFYEKNGTSLPPLDVNNHWGGAPSPTSDSISVELLFHCEHGDVGPFPMNQLKANETRTFECNMKDVGNPKYCIVIMYREEKRAFPKWCIKNVSMNVIRQDEHVRNMYRHVSVLPGGDAVVYSITMAPYNTEITNRNTTSVSIEIEPEPHFKNI